MKKQLLIALLLITAPFMVSAQQAAETVNVSVNVNAAITLTKNADVLFGNISLDAVPDLDPTGASHSDVGATATVGQIDISGTDGAQATVTFPASVNLGNGVANTITYTPSIAGHASTQSSATPVTSGSQVTFGASGYKIWIGGTLDLSEAIVGTYASNASNGDGDMTVTVEYY